MLILFKLSEEELNILKQVPDWNDEITCEVPMGDPKFPIYKELCQGGLIEETIHKSKYRVRCFWISDLGRMALKQNPIF